MTGVAPDIPELMISLLVRCETLSANYIILDAVTPTPTHTDTYLMFGSWSSQSFAKLGLEPLTKPNLSSALAPNDQEHIIYLRIWRSTRSAYSLAFDGRWPFIQCEV